jgi:hypothetical protein
MSSDLSLAQHTALSFLLSQHNSDLASREASKVEVVVVRNAEPKAKGSKSHAKGEQAAPIHDGPKVFGVTMPERNTLDAKGFLNACRDAGKRRNAEGKPIFDAREVRNDLICAIHAYIGYDNRRDFGSQDIEARSQAQRELRGVAPGPTREEKRAASRSGRGFIAGLPDHKARRLQDLLARETAAVDAMLQYQKEATEAYKTSRVDALRLEGLAEVERERLSAIRRDILTMGF